MHFLFPYRKEMKNKLKLESPVSANKGPPRQSDHISEVAQQRGLQLGQFNDSGKGGAQQ